MDRPFGLACGVVSRDGAAPVLNVIHVDRPERSVDVEAERVGGRWWYRDAETGEGLVPVDEVDKAPAVLARVLARGVE
ncbi:hypothetical protein [Actinomadura sp. 21ATH]|uniref:hypothetical protein n=1 Tax=Actinomadura sp. 21ATH TaxID=1735444 RepID=UPI0035C18FE5